jgi:hypothetical protein
MSTSPSWRSRKDRPQLSAQTSQYRREWLRFGQANPPVTQPVASPDRPHGMPHSVHIGADGRMTTLWARTKSGLVAVRDPYATHEKPCKKNLVLALRVPNQRIQLPRAPRASEVCSFMTGYRSPFGDSRV